MLPPLGQGVGQVDAELDEEAGSCVDVVDYDIDLVDARRTHGANVPAPYASGSKHALKRRI
jgi:hypothetical protein